MKNNKLCLLALFACTKNASNVYLSLNENRFEKRKKYRMKRERERKRKIEENRIEIEFSKCTYLKEKMNKN